MNKISELPTIKGCGRTKTSSLRLCILLAIWSVTAYLSARLRRKHNLSKGAMPEDMSPHATGFSLHERDTISVKAG
jgi:hypothetical protein